MIWIEILTYTFGPKISFNWYHCDYLEIEYIYIYKYILDIMVDIIVDLYCELLPISNCSDYSRNVCGIWVELVRPLRPH